ncbi:MAG: hypothetical protein ACOY3P_22940 [Planctomycetota bacterium]
MWPFRRPKRQASDEIQAWFDNLPETPTDVDQWILDFARERYMERIESWKSMEEKAESLLRNAAILAVLLATAFGSWKLVPAQYISAPLVLFIIAMVLAYLAKAPGDTPAVCTVRYVIDAVAGENRATQPILWLSVQYLQATEALRDRIKSKASKILWAYVCVMLAVAGSALAILMSPLE